MGNDRFGSPGTADRRVDSRGRRAEEWGSSVAREAMREFAPGRADLERLLAPPPPEKEPADLHLQFFKALLDVQGWDPLSPKRAREIYDQWGLRAPNVSDPAAREAALLGFELVLTVASFVPAVSAPATGALVVLALVRGKSGALEAGAAVVPLGRLANAAKVIRALTRMGRVFRPATIKEYKEVARLLIQRDRNLAQLKNRLEAVQDAAERKAAQAAIAEYRRVLRATGDARAASQAAGNTFHASIGAAGAGQGADIVYKGGKFIVEVKTHYVPIVDDLVLRGGSEQVIAYVLKDIVEKGVVRQARVHHFFIDPVKGKAVRLVIDPLNGQDIVNALIRLGGKR